MNRASARVSAPVGMMALFSDTHIGSTVGLSPSTVTLYDGQTVKASWLQEWLAERWRDYSNGIINEAKAFKADNPDFRLFVVHNGDVVEGCVKRSPQIMAATLFAQQRDARTVLSPIFEAADYAVVVRGTEAHVDLLSQAEESFCELLNIKSKFVLFDGYSLTTAHARLVFHGVRFDIAHHVSTTAIPAGRPGNVARQIAQEIVSAVETGEVMPDYMVRSHAHRKADTGQTYSYVDTVGGGAERITRGIVLPCFQLKTAFTHRVGTATLPHIGGAIVRFYDDGSHTFEFKTYPVLRRYRSYVVIGVKDDARKTQVKSRRKAAV